MDSEHVELVLVADGYSEWAVATYVAQECTDVERGVYCVFWKAAECETNVVHIDDVCEGYWCGGRP